MGTRSIINKEPVDIIIPTYDNVDMLLEAVTSMIATRFQYPLRFIIVNNGSAPLEKCFPENNKNFLIVKPESNLGWTGGILEGLKHSSSKYVMFCNDDIFLPRGCWRWMSTMVRHLELKSWVGAVGPITNCAMGAQNLFRSDIDAICFYPQFFIGFMILFRRSTLDEIGGVDPEFVTGDDLDLSIRLIKNGYHILVDSSVFVYHYGFQTGNKVHGDHKSPGGWNSREMTENTNMQLIRKHGFLWWWYMWAGYPKSHKMRDNTDKRNEDEIVRKRINGFKPDLIVDLGCGGSKVIKDSIGVDILPRGEVVPNTGHCSDADIVADVEKRMPFEDGRFKIVIARHVLEHCMDIIGALKEWKRILADDGKMIICLPDERIADTIIMNPEHVHAFNPESLKKIVKTIGMEVESLDEYYQSESFTMVMRKTD
jgi:predicted SAM-dependent methyltransferase/glycosyltransferase involved in cell wall biosynthesis